MFNIASKDKQLDRTTVSSVFYKLGQKEKKEKTRISELLVDFHENGLLLTILFLQYQLQFRCRILQVLLL
jgi:hypothetical protein